MIKCRYCGADLYTSKSNLHEQTMHKKCVSLVYNKRELDCGCGIVSGSGNMESKAGTERLRLLDSQRNILYHYDNVYTFDLLLLLLWLQKHILFY